MPKVEAIINQIQTNCPNVLPEVTQVFESDPQRIAEALKERGKNFQYYAILRMLQSETARRLKADFLKPLLEINLKDLAEGEFKVELRLKVCEAIIEAEDQYRTNTIDKLLGELANAHELSNLQRARLEVVSAGNNVLKGEYAKASSQYLAASRMEAYLRDENTKLSLLNTAIALAFAAPLSPDSHRVVCALCLSETARKSHLFALVGKLYRADILSREDVVAVEAFLPSSLKRKDEEGVSRVGQATFCRNMIPIMKCFSAIRLGTLQKLIGIADLEELLLLLEKTYQCGEISIDQVAETVQLSAALQPQQFVKDFLSQVDLLLQE